MRSCPPASAQMRATPCPPRSRHRPPCATQRVGGAARARIAIAGPPWHVTPVGEAVGTFREEGAGSRRPPMALARCAVTKRNLSVVDLSAMARRGPPLRAAVEGAVGGASATPRRSPPRPGTDRERAGNSVRGRGSGGGGGYAAAGRRRKLYLRILLSAQNLVKSQRGAQSGRHVRGANSRHGAASTKSGPPCSVRQ